MILSLASLNSDTDSRTVNMVTLTVWRLGTSRHYVHVKQTILNSVTGLINVLRMSVTSLVYQA